MDSVSNIWPGKTRVTKRDAFLLRNHNRTNLVAFVSVGIACVLPAGKRSGSIQRRVSGRFFVDTHIARVFSRALCVYAERKGSEKYNYPRYSRASIALAGEASQDVGIRQRDARLKKAGTRRRAGRKTRKKILSSWSFHGGRVNSGISLPRA